MRTQHARQVGSHVAPRKAEYWFLAALALIAALIGGAFVASPRVLAGDTIDADSLRWAAIGEAYAASLARGSDADSLRWAALGKHYAGSLARSSDADSDRWAAIGKFYSSRSGDGVLASNPELRLSRAYSLSQADSVLASNPELRLSRAYSLSQAAGAVACSLEGRDEVLGANPELVYSTLAQEC